MSTSGGVLNATFLCSHGTLTACRSVAASTWEAAVVRSADLPRDRPEVVSIASRRDQMLPRGPGPGRGRPRLSCGRGPLVRTRLGAASETQRAPKAALSSRNGTQAGRRQSHAVIPSKSSGRTLLDDRSVFSGARYLASLSVTSEEGVSQRTKMPYSATLGESCAVWHVCSGSTHLPEGRVG